MKQVFLFAFIMPIFSTAIFCDEIVYMVTQDSVLGDRTSGGGGARVSKGETVFSQGIVGASYRNMGTDNIRVYEILVRTEQEDKGWMQADHILLKDNHLLSDSVISKRWIFSYYQDVILECRRNSLYKYEPFWCDNYDDSVIYTSMPDECWWDFHMTDFHILNNMIDISYILSRDLIYFATTKQEQDNTVILIQCICTYKSNFLPQSYWNTTFNEGETYKFIFKIDGDYMDVFLNDNPVKICTLIGVDDYFVNGIVRGESVDLTRVIWPRRADGSMDYPPPLDMSNYIATHHTTDSLRLQDSANTAAKLVTTLPRNTDVQVIETGSTSTIGGITGSWVKVISSTGYTGWCFSGYLEEIKKPDTDNTTAEISQTDEVFETRKDSQSLPFGALIAIIGGAVVVAGGIALLIVKRKK